MKTRPWFLGFIAIFAVLAAASRGHAQAEPAAEDVISLAGRWQASLDPKQEGVKQGFFNQELQERIDLPGSTDQAHLGKPNDCKPTLAGLYRLYMYEGPAWFRARWKSPPRGRASGCRSSSNAPTGKRAVWLDGREQGMQNSLIAPQVFDLGVGLSPGKHRLAICTDNTRRLNLGPICSIRDEGTQTNWNGLLGKIELRRKTPWPSRTCRSTPDVNRKLVKVRVTIANATGKRRPRAS